MGALDPMCSLDFRSVILWYTRAVGVHGAPDSYDKIRVGFHR